ncbi:hypothetical protein BV25DRAFT_1915184 [Artomyces pyxidatus]|uniref:Uncharacterized protein n=1 Tax=Artomyces pyxidatus TaxID=48021 RepID=A0ACB8T707_9AGAM|nr:hypothetical protein BV25DRAFT_1915184 [Artomyces pyxidatus]
MPPYIPLDDQINALRDLYKVHPGDDAVVGWQDWILEWCTAVEKFLLCVKNCPERRAARTITLGAIASALHAKPSWTAWMEIAVPQARVYLERWAHAYAAQVVRGKVPGLTVEQENELIEEEIQELMVRVDTGEFDDNQWACLAVERGFDSEDLIYRRPKSPGEILWNDWCLANKDGVRGDKVRARAAAAAADYEASAPAEAQRRKRVDRDEGEDAADPVEEASPDVTPRPVKKRRPGAAAGETTEAPVLSVPGPQGEPDFEPGEVAKELAESGTSTAYQARMARRRFLRSSNAPRPVAEWRISGTVVEPGCTRCSLKTVRYVCRQNPDRATCIKCHDMHEQCSLAQGVKPGPRRKSAVQAEQAVPPVPAEASPVSMGRFITADGQVLGGIPTSLEGLRLWRSSIMDKIEVARSEIALQERRIEDLRQNQVAVEQAIADFERSGSLELEGSLTRLSLVPDDGSPLLGPCFGERPVLPSDSGDTEWEGFGGEGPVDLEAEEDNDPEDSGKEWSPVGSEEL